VFVQEQLRIKYRTYVHGKNDFAEGSKILLDRSENNAGTLKISNAAKNIDILAI